MDTGAVLDDARPNPTMQARPTEPEPWAVRAEGLGVEVDVTEGVVLSGEVARRTSPQSPPGSEVLVEEGAAALERDAQGIVLVPTPTDRGQHDEPPFAQEVQSRQFLGEEQRVPQGNDDRARHEPDPVGDRGDRAEYHQRAR